MKQNTNSLLPEFYTISKKANRRFFYLQVVFLFALVFALSASAIAQTVDYNLPKNWMCHPVLKSTDVARQQKLTLLVKNPDMSTKDSITYPQDTLVDIFYIYPTIDMDTAVLGNTSMESIDTITAQFVYREQAGIYARFGRVFVPYYRQAKISVFLTKSLADTAQLKNAECLEKAYNDIDSAFNNYLKYYNKGRKIILIGHSQGADLERFLLRKRFDNNPYLKSLLVVALSGGEPNYVSTNGSRTGGSLQNIKTCPPKDSIPECGCVMNWRTWSKQSPGGFLNKTSFYYNHFFADTGLIYQTCDTVNNTHIESTYDFGYSHSPVQKMMPRFISLDSTMTDYLAFDSLFKAEVTHIPAALISSYLWIDSTYTPNDHRKTGEFPGINGLLQGTIPIPSWAQNYHIWDMQFVQWDLLNMLPNLIAITHPMNFVPELNKLENSVLVYPNPTNGIVHVSTNNQKIKSIRLYNLQGEFVEEFFTNDFSVLKLTAGTYLLNIQTDKSTFSNKLVKQ